MEIQEPVEEIFIPPEKKRRNIKQIRKNIMKMEQYKVSKLFNNSTVTKSVTKKWIKVNDLSSCQYSVNKNVRLKTSTLRSDRYDYNDACIVVKGTIDLVPTAANENYKAEKVVAFKNNALFRSCISNISSTMIDNTEDLDIVMPIYNLLEYSQTIIWHQEVYEIIVDMKLMMLMVMLQKVNHFNKKQK